MSTPVQSLPQPADKRLPWLLAFFFLLVFAFSSPLQLAGNSVDMSLDAAMRAAETGSVQRELALSFLGLFALGVFFRRKRWGLRMNGLLAWLFILYTGLVLVSPVWAQDPSLAIRRAGVFGLLFLASVALTVRLTRARIVSFTIAACSLALVISLILQVATGNFHPLDSTWRFSGLFYSVGQGWNCGLLAIAALDRAASVPRQRSKLIFLAALAMVFLVLTRSRMPFVSAVLGIAVLGVFVSRSTLRLTLLAVSLAVVLTGALYLGLTGAGGSTEHTVESAVSMGRGEATVSSLTTFTGRSELWAAELGYAKYRPLLGYGYDSFFDPSNLAAVSGEAGWVPNSAHSGFIGTLLSLGYVGAICFVLILIYALSTSFTLARESPDGAFLIAVVVWMVMNLFMESAVISSTSLPTLICLLVLSHLAFNRHQANVDEFDKLN